MPWPTPTFDECKALGNTVTTFPDGPNSGKPACAYRNNGLVRHAAIIGKLSLTQWLEAQFNASIRDVRDGAQMFANGVTQVGTSVVVGTVGGAASGVAQGVAGPGGGAGDGPPIPNLFKTLFGVDLKWVIIAFFVLMAFMVYTGQAASAARIVRR